MNHYSLLVFVHVAAATVLVASSLVGPLARAAMRSASSVQALSGAIRIEEWLGRACPPAALVVLGTAVWLGSFGFWAAPWFWGAAALFVMSCVLAVAFRSRHLRRIADRVAQVGHGVVPAELDTLRRSRGAALVANLMLAGDVATLYFMVAKPLLAATLVVGLGSLAVAAGVTFLGRRETRVVTRTVPLRTMDERTSQPAV